MFDTIMQYLTSFCLLISAVITGYLLVCDEMKIRRLRNDIKNTNRETEKRQ